MTIFQPPVFGQLIRDGCVRFHRSHKLPLLQLADFAAFALARKQWLAYKSRRSAVDHQVFEILAEVGQCFIGLETFRFTRSLVHALTPRDWAALTGEVRRGEEARNPDHRRDIHGRLLLFSVAVRCYVALVLEHLRTLAWILVLAGKKAMDRVLGTEWFSRQAKRAEFLAGWKLVQEAKGELRLKSQEGTLLATISPFGITYYPYKDMTEEHVEILRLAHRFTPKNDRAIRTSEGRVFATLEDYLRAVGAMKSAP